jgi:nucleotide-binding universal stress UspA family protein
MPGIVVGVDGSAHSRKALEWALAESALRRTPLTVLTVSPVASSIFGLSAQHYPPADEKAETQAQEAAARIVDEAIAGQQRPPEASVTVRAVTGIPADELIRASDGADMLVVGSRGAGGFSRLMMGSVSSQVSHHARCAVVIVPPDEGR